MSPIDEFFAMIGFMVTVLMIVLAAIVGLAWLLT